MKTLGSGSYADVMVVKSPENKELAMKVVREEYAWKLEAKNGEVNV